MAGISEEMTYLEFYTRENSTKHTPLENEMLFYEMVKKGNLKEVKSLIQPLGSEGFGVLSSDYLRNIKYHMIISVALITRFCVEGGMEHEMAYNLSDLYIVKTDNAASKKEIDAIHMEMICDFTKRMSHVNKKSSLSKHVIKCCEYVYNHVNQHIKIADIADTLGLSEQYLSKLFRQETGVQLSKYIMKKKIETAEQMLRFSEYDAVDIANFLAFSSHSHFIMVFRKATGLTPRQYRNRYYHDSDGLKATPAKEKHVY